MAEIAWRLIDTAVAFRVTGRDSRRYLHNRLSQEIRSLQPGRETIAALLTAQGRVECVFLVVCEREDTFLLISDGGEASSIQGALKRFIVADRVSIEEISASEVNLVHIALDKEQTKTALSSELKIELRIVSRPRIGQKGSDLIVIGVTREELVTFLTSRFGGQLTKSHYDILRWRAGCAVFPDEINESGMLLEYGLREAVSFTKGCYVGQEVVERSDAIGRAPRQLKRVALRGADMVRVGASVTNPAGEPIGKVVSSISAPDEAQCYLFAFLSTGRYQPGDLIRCAEREGIVL